MGLAMSHLKIVKPTTEAQKATETTVDTIIVTPALAKSWKLPSFQRPLSWNKKCEEVRDEIKETLVIPGVIELGVVEKQFYLVDGQHRRECFLRAEILEAFADVRYLHFETMAEMAEEFKKVNGRLVSLRADDTLRASEEGSAPLRRLRVQFPLVGYDQVRRNDRSPVVSMSALLRCWFGSAPEVPSLGGLSAANLVDQLTDDEVDQMLGFLGCAQKAWGRDVEHQRLWSNLNLAICMWMYRRLVITPYSANIKKLPREIFQKCLMSVAADGEYHDWLVGRNLRERDRSPTYQRIKTMFAKRIEQETGIKPRLPQPGWGGR